MEHDDVTVRRENGTGPARHRVAPPAVAILVLGVLIALGAYRGSTATAPDEELPDPGPDQLERATLVVGDFAVAWNEADLEALDGMVADDWDSIGLPGFLDARFVPSDGRPALRDGLAFLTAVAGLTLGPCEAEVAPPEAEAATLVYCDQASFRGDYLAALGRDFRRAEPAEPVPGVAFGIRNDRIVSIDTDAQAFAPQAYCLWTESTRPRPDQSMFDLSCYPVTTAATGPAHAEAAAAFLAAGAPLPSQEAVEARYVASYVGRFVENFNVGDPLAGIRWLSSGLTPAGLPGFAGAVEEPAVSDFLAWGSRLMSIDTGPCDVQFGAGPTIVTCPDMTLGGLLFEEPQPEPMRFTLVDSVTRESGDGFERIVRAERLSGEPVGLGEVCRRVQRLRPTVAAVVFTDDCHPVYTAETAGVLATVLQQWRDSPNQPQAQIGIELQPGG